MSTTSAISTSPLFWRSFVEVCCGFPRAHWQKIWSTNPLESPRDAFRITRRLELGGSLSPLPKKSTTPRNAPGYDRAMPFRRILRSLFSSGGALPPADRQPLADRRREAPELKTSKDWREEFELEKELRRGMRGD